MSDKKLGLDKLKVQSFVTSFSKDSSQTIKGGDIGFDDGFSEPGGFYNCTNNPVGGPCKDPGGGILNTVDERCGADTNPQTVYDEICQSPC